MLHRVRFLRSYRHDTAGFFNVGEGAAFEDALAESLVAEGIAEMAETVKALDAPPSHKMIERAPSKKKIKESRGFEH